MKTISGQLVSTKPVSLSRAAKLISRFAAVDNGSSAAVSIYLQRAAEAFNHLVQYHGKPSINSGVKQSPDRKSVQKLQTNDLEEKSDGKKVGDVENRGKTDGKSVKTPAEEKPPHREEVEELSVEKEEQMAEEEEKKKKKLKRKRKGGEFDPKEKSSRKKRMGENLDSSGEFGT